MTVVLVGAVAAVTLLAFAAPPASANNILPTGWSSISTQGTFGTLRNTDWAAGASLGSVDSIVDGAFLPEGTQWNSGSWWWDQDPSVNSSPVVTTIYLTHPFTLYGLTIQADNNDVYRIEYWDGGAWQLAWDAPSVLGWGLMTRSSGTLPGITTDRLQITAVAGDNYYAISEIQASNVPEPTTLALLGAGLVAARARLRRRR
jgi:hypothetical protein